MRPCPVCGAPLDFPADPDGHDEGCRYPDSWRADAARVDRAARNLGRAVVRDFTSVRRKVLGH